MRILYLNEVVADRDVHVTRCLEISRGLERLGHRPRCLLFFDRKQPETGGLSGVHFVRLATGKWHTPLVMLWHIFRILLASREDVAVYEPSFWPAALAVKILRRGRLPMVMDIRSVPVDLEPGLKGRLRRFRYRLSLATARWAARGITVITPGLRRELCRATGWKEDEVGCWSSAVETDRFRCRRPAGASAAAPSSADPSAGEAIHLCAAYHGVLSPTRGLQGVISAIRILKDEGLRVRFLLVGDGPARVELERLAEAEGVEDLVVFTGKVPYEAVPSRLDESDVGVVPLPDLPGWRVSSPLKLLECCAMARPVVVSRIEAHVSVLDKSPGAFYVDEISPPSLADALRKVFARKNDLASLGEANRRIVEGRFGWDRQAERLEAYLEKVLAGAWRPPVDKVHRKGPVPGKVRQ